MSYVLAFKKKAVVHEYTLEDFDVIVCINLEMK